MQHEMKPLAHYSLLDWVTYNPEPVAIDDEISYLVPIYMKLGPISLDEVGPEWFDGNPIAPAFMYVNMDDVSRLYSELKRILYPNQ